MANTFAEVMEDLGLHVARVLNPEATGVYGGLLEQQTQPSYGGQPRMREQPSGMNALSPQPVAQTPMPDVMPAQGWQPQPQRFPDTQGGSPALAAPVPPVTPAPATAPAPPVAAAGLPQPAADLAGGVATLIDQLTSGGPPDVSREGSVNPMQPPSGAPAPLPVGSPDETLLRMLGMEPRPTAPSISTLQMSGYEPQPATSPSRQGEYGPAWSSRSPSASPTPGRGGGGGAGGPPPPVAAGGANPSSAASTPPAASPSAAPSAGGGSGLGSIFGSISPRTFQIMGVIGATLAMGARPGESAAGTLGRAIGAGMMYDNFANLSEHEQAVGERGLRIKEAQLGLEGQRVGQQGQLTTARIAAIKADIENDKRKLALATDANEREAIMDKIKRQSALIGLAFQPEMLAADLATKRAAAGKPGDTARAQFLTLVEKSKNTDGTTDWKTVSRASRLAGLGKSAPAEVLAEGRRRLAAVKDTRQRAQMQEQMNSYLIDKGFLPELD